MCFKLIFLINYVICNVNYFVIFCKSKYYYKYIIEYAIKNDNAYINNNDLLFCYEKYKDYQIISNYLKEKIIYNEDINFIYNLLDSLKKDISYSNIFYINIISLEILKQYNKIIIINPIYFWTQNKEYIFIKILLSNNINYPLNIITKYKYISVRPDKLILRIYDIINSIFIIFELNYFQPVISILSSYNQINNKSFEFKIKKGFGIIWRNIHYNARVIEKNQYIWEDLEKLYYHDIISEYNIIKKAKSNINKTINKNIKSKKDTAKINKSNKKINKNLKIYIDKIDKYTEEIEINDYFKYLLS